MQGRWKNQSDFFRRKINIAYFYILFAKSYSLSKVYGFERDKTYKRWIAIDENIVKVYTDFITCFVFLGKIYKSDQFQERENKNMKNMKVRTKLNLILVLVILLVALGSVVSFKDLEDVKDKALETMDASSRQSYDDSIKEQVGVVISLLSEINDAYKAGTYTLDEAKKIAADEVRQMRYGETGYFWIDESDGTKKMIAALPVILLALQEGRLVIIDELDAKLHPKLLRYVISLFKNKNVNKKGAQLLFTSHDMTTMKNTVFRRDEIWFAAENERHESEIYSLYEIRRENNERVNSTAAYDKQYLEGRYGADPYLTNMLAGGEWL